MSDDVAEPSQDNSGESDPNVVNELQKSAENTTGPEHAEAIANSEREETNPTPAEDKTGELNQEVTAADAAGDNTEAFHDKVNEQANEPTESSQVLVPDSVVEHAAPSNENIKTGAVIEPSEQQSTAAAEVETTEAPPSNGPPKDEPHSSEEEKEKPQPTTVALPADTLDVKPDEEKVLTKSTEPSTAEVHTEQESTLSDAIREKITRDVSDTPIEDSFQDTKVVADQTDEKLQELEELVRKASEGSAQKKVKTENASLTKRLYEEQIKTGKLNRLTSVREDEDGTKRLVTPGSVPHWNTISISLAGKRPMPNEKCRKGEHNCFDSAAARRERALSASLAQGLYPDFMKLNPKLNEFVAASILEKLRLKGLAAPLHLYRGRYLPSDVLAEMVLQPKKKKVTDRYYFGYVPPPNRPRISGEFRRYLQQFSERHRAEESDLCYSYAMKRVRKLASQSTDHQTLPQALAEVVRAQEEPGFGVKRLRRPHTAVI